MRIGSKLDRYLTFNFLSSYFICFLFFLGLFIVIDLVPKVDDLLDAARDAAKRGDSLIFLAVWFYLLKIPEIFLVVAPYLTVMAAMFCLSRLRKNNEIVPMIMAGVSIHRVILPMIILAGCLMGGMVAVQEFLAPACAEKRMILKAFLIDHKETLLIKRESFFDQAGKQIDIHNYNVATRVIGNVDVSFIQQEGGKEINCSIKGRNLRWLGPEEQAWSMDEGFLIKDNLTDPDAEWVRQSVKILKTDIQPSDIVFAEKEMSDLTFREIQRAYSRNPEDLKMKILLHYHITFPLSNLLLLLLGVPFVLRFEARSHFLGLTFALLICGGYFVLDVIMRDLGSNGQLSPVVAAWLSSIFCGAVGIYLFDSIKT